MHEFCFLFMVFTRITIIYKTPNRYSGVFQAPTKIVFHLLAPKIARPRGMSRITGLHNDTNKEPFIKNEKSKKDVSFLLNKIYKSWTNSGPAWTSIRVWANEINHFSILWEKFTKLLIQVEVCPGFYKKQSIGREYSVSVMSSRWFLVY